MAKHLKIPVFAKHLLFWLSVFLYFVITADMVFYKDYVHLFESTLGLMIPQIIVAYFLLQYAIPKFLNQKKYVKFGLSSLGVLVLLFAGYAAFRKFYFDVVYIEAYNEIARYYATLPYLQRVLDAELFLSKMVKFLTPAALLFTYGLYKNQQEVLELREQKRNAELDALKNQLNPHFLFNTLNNLYALSIEKSDKAPEVIERLSDMLDYMLYRCKENFVSLAKEVELLENYIALEKIRYGDRVNITFNKELNQTVAVAPLLFLTFAENAFKHGVSQELTVAKVTLDLHTTDKNIVFSIANTKPKMTEVQRGNSNRQLGLVNTKRQLGLLYGDDYDLSIDETEKSYTVKLIIPAYEL